MFYYKYKKLFLPLGAAVVMLIAGVFIANFFITRITQIVADTSEQKTKNTVLTGRVTTLQTLSADIKSAVNSATLAIPDKNPSIFVVSQLKNSAEKNSVVLRNLSIGPGTTPAESQLANYNISFEAEASDYASFFSFIGSLSSVTPLVNLSTLEINKDGGPEVMARVELAAYSSAFPNELPALEEPLIGLTPGEQSVLDLIGSFTPPTLSTQGAQPETAPRENPFSLDI